MQIQIRSADEPSTTFYKCVHTVAHGLIEIGGSCAVDGADSVHVSAHARRCCNMECSHQWREN